MRVLHLITPRHVGGAELLALRMMQTQKEMGVTSRLLLRHHPHMELYAKRQGLDVVTAPIGGKLNLRAVSAIAQQIRSFRPDVVCTHLSSATLWGSLAARMCKVPCVALVHGFNSASAYRFATRLVCVSQAVGEFILQQGIPHEKIEVIHNGIDPRPYLCAEPACLPLPAAAFCVGTVAHLSVKKGYRELVQVAQMTPHAHFVLVGEGPLRKELEQAAAGTLQGRLHLMGFQENIPALMKRFDVFCLPSHKEPFGLVVLEAMAAAKPVVAFREGGVPEIVVENETGLLSSFSDTAAMAQNLKQLQQNVQMRESMGMAGRARALSEFTLERCCRRLLDLFEEVSR